MSQLDILHGPRCGSAVHHTCAYCLYASTSYIYSRYIYVVPRPRRQCIPPKRKHRVQTCIYVLYEYIHTVYSIQYSSSMHYTCKSVSVTKVLHIRAKKTKFGNCWCVAIEILFRLKFFPSLPFFKRFIFPFSPRLVNHPIQLQPPFPFENKIIFSIFLCER